jgi:hypothetical protein
MGCGGKCSFTGDMGCGGREWTAEDLLSDGFADDVCVVTGCDVKCWLVMICGGG